MIVEVHQVLLVIAALIAIIVAVASVAAFLRASLAKAQIDALRGDRDDLKERVRILEEENERKTLALQTEADKVKVLERVVTGKEALDRLQVSVDEAFVKLDNKHDELYRCLDETKKAVQELILLETGKKQ